MAKSAPSTRALRRLEEELQEDDVPLPSDPDLRQRVIEELQAVRRPPVHERRTAFYGSFVVPPGRSLLVGGDLSDLVALDGYPLDRARRFADGRSSFLVRLADGSSALACYRRSVQYEADLVEIQEGTGATIAQRTVMGSARMFSAEGVVEWNGHHWGRRPTAAARVPAVAPHSVGVSYEVVEGILDLCVHWLSPGQIGATVVLVLSPSHELHRGVDHADSYECPPLSARRREHFPAFLAAMSQTDLAVIVDAGGTVRRMGVGLRSSRQADELISDPRGMRHRSARRFSFDHPETVAFVVSEEGPVTVSSDGAVVGGVPPATRPVAPPQHRRCPRCRRLVEVIAGVSARAAGACPACGELSGFEDATTLGVIKERTWLDVPGADRRSASSPPHLHLGAISAGGD